MELNKETMYNLLNKFGVPYTTTENGAVTPATSGSVLIDQFGKAANYRNRPFEEVCKDMEALWLENDKDALAFVFYLRLITRVVKYPNGKETEKVQKGQGCRDEVFKRLLWIASRHPEKFYERIFILPLVGSWKDIWELMYYGFQFGVKLNEEILFSLMAHAMSNDTQIDLFKKFMPRIKTKSNIKSDRTRFMTSVAKSFAKFLRMTPRQYNKFKSDGKAHEFQRLMCNRQFDELQWGKIPGIALGKITASKFIDKHNLTDNYLAWLSTQDTVKFNGYPYDLLIRLNKCVNSAYTDTLATMSRGINELPLIARKTADMQFDNLIATAQRDGKITENVLCVLDTSGSMSTSTNPRIAPIDVCISLGLYFSTLNQGHFHKKVVMFDNRSRMQELHGSFSEMLCQIPLNAMGGTNFSSVINLLIEYRRHNPNIPIEEYPTTLLVVSDMQFNPPMTREYTHDARGRRIMRCIGDNKELRSELIKTNYKSMIQRLSEVFPQEFVEKMKFIWWNVNGEHENMPATMNDGGCYFFSGFDGAIVSLLLNEDAKEKKTNEPKTMEEVVHEALSQEIFSLLD